MRQIKRKSILICTTDFYVGLTEVLLQETVYAEAAWWEEKYERFYRQIQVKSEAPS